MHVFCLCKEVTLFWKMVSLVLTKILDYVIPCAPAVLLLNDFSTLDLSQAQRRTLLTGLTAAKTMLAMRWSPPHTLTKPQWLASYLDIVNMELSIARIHGAKERTILSWSTALTLVLPSGHFDPIQYLSNIQQYIEL